MSGEQLMFEDDRLVIRLLKRGEDGCWTVSLPRGTDLYALLEELGRFSNQALAALQAGRSLLEEHDRLKATEGEIRREVKENRAILSRDWTFGRFVGRAAVETLGRIDCLQVGEVRLSVPSSM